MRAVLQPGLLERERLVQPAEAGAVRAVLVAVLLQVVGVRLSVVLVRRVLAHEQDVPVGAGAAGVVADVLLPGLVADAVSLILQVLLAAESSNRSAEAVHQAVLVAALLRRPCALLPVPRLDARLQLCHLRGLRQRDFEREALPLQPGEPVRIVPIVHIMLVPSPQFLLFSFLLVIAGTHEVRVRDNSDFALLLRLGTHGLTNHRARARGGPVVWWTGTGQNAKVVRLHRDYFPNLAFLAVSVSHELHPPAPTAGRRPNRPNFILCDALPAVQVDLFQIF